ncbi:hypothetical protein CARUB_v10007349mg [Capsella rubella]|uniref:F-box domain-containing protein n=1 Tax=Capsella rubella TaxID=81985 RepID=R0GGC0_9BRAS|nr:hypothetical protein CARUB_v10007349mg [Capsella rubella]
MDRISDLPNALICHILSFLPIKEAVSTSVLAKRWKPLFLDQPNLVFDDSIYFNPPTSYKEKLTNARSFMRFVDGVLASQGNAPLNKFKLVGNFVVDELWVLEWIPNLLKRGVSDIHLNISSFWADSDRSKFDPLPPEMFVNKTLVSLTIIFEGGVNINVEGDVSLPKLKILHLNYFKTTTSTFNKILSGCHVLEELALTNLMWDGALEVEPCLVTVSIPTLERLTFVRYGKYDDANKGVPLSFDNPNVVYMEYDDTIADTYQQMSFGSLVEAKLGLRPTPDQLNYEGYDDYEINLLLNEMSSVTNFLNGVGNVKILHVNVNMLWVLGSCRDTIPVFNNLIHLTIATYRGIIWKALPALLKSCPNLVTLAFESLKLFPLCFRDYITYTQIDVWMCLCKFYVSNWRVVVRPCLSSSPVKVIEIFNFGENLDDDDDIDDDGNGGLVHCLKEKIDHVKFFLHKMPNLEQVRLHFLFSNEEDVMMKVFKELQELPREVASPNCNIQVLSDNLSLSFNTSD